MNVDILLKVIVIWIDIVNKMHVITQVYIVDLNFQIKLTLLIVNETL